MRELIKVSFLKHPTGAVARHDVYQTDTGYMGYIYPIKAIKGEEDE